LKANPKGFAFFLNMKGMKMKKGEQMFTFFAPNLP